MRILYRNDVKCNLKNKDNRSVCLFLGSDHVTFFLERKREKWKSSIVQYGFKPILNYKTFHISALKVR